MARRPEARSGQATEAIDSLAGAAHIVIIGGPVKRARADAHQVSER